jgi:hypothetical protein
MPAHPLVKPRTLRFVALVAVGLLAAACSSSPSALHTTTTSTGHDQTHAAGSKGAAGSSHNSTKSTKSGKSSGSGTGSNHSTDTPYSAIHKSVGLFDSPDKNISCELDHSYKASPTGVPLNNVTCITQIPPQSVVLSPSGTLTVCTGAGCTWAPIKGSPILQYGTATGAGAVRCDSATGSMTCKVSGAKGFTISSTGVTPLGGATIASQQKTN